MMRTFVAEPVGFFLLLLIVLPCCRVLFQPKAQKGKPAEKVVHPFSRKAAYLAREEIRLKRKERSEKMPRYERDIKFIWEE